MFDKMKQLMEMKKQADQIKKELDATNIESNDVEGIKIVINGSQELKSIEIDKNMIDSQGKDNFEADLLRGINTAIKKSQDLAAQKMKSMLPGFPGA